MYDIITQLCLKLTLQEKQNLLIHLECSIDEELAFKKHSVSTCPHCGSNYFVRKGYNRDGEQRWLCKSCNHTFSKQTKGLLSTSKLDAHTWHEACKVHHRSSFFTGVRKKMWYIFTDKLVYANEAL